MDNEAYTTIINDPHMADLLGQELIRDDLLPSILGSDNHDISYWAGKHLARNHRLATYDDLIAFFDQFKLGKLNLLKKSGQQLNWELSGPIVKNRLDLFDDPDFYLETGFIAQSCQYILNQVAEAEITKTNPAKGIVLISTYLGKDKPVDNQESDKMFTIAHSDTDQSEDLDSDH